ncbi:MAG: SRPBCC family protein [Actinobacteria bacterium]|uniref:Unannotated protein n=1 Tax=freshwater metagenome TaxID=449393 RepID=A0A6J6J9B0_9ZZZZ|nr:SRPBCC family protein [Actinomycetota bacterium]MSZ18527.1 SRPBCC family protein [Actinomycetota bacterium]
MATVSVTQDISAPAELVWALVTDLPRMGEWSPENLGGEWVKGATGAAVGARFKGRNKNGNKAWSSSVKVNEVDAPNKFSFALMALGKNWCDWVYEITPSGAGCTVTHSWIDHRSKFADRLGKLVSGVSNRAEHNRRNMEATLKNLKAAAEN